MSRKIPTGERLPPYTLFVDSNCLYTPNEVEIINLAFSDLFTELRSKCEIELAIPDIVASEILNKKLDDCEAYLKEATSGLDRIAKLTLIEPVRLPNIEDLRLNLKSRFDRRVESLGASIIPVPSVIDWTSLIEKAVSRRPPFSPRSEKGEKGFKDALILETLIEVYKNSPGRVVVFVCADALLFKTACNQLAGSRFLGVTSLEEFRSHLELRITQTNEKFTQALLIKAKDVFYTKSDANCIWFRFGMLDKMHEALGAQWSGFFGDVYEPVPTRLLSVGLVSAPLMPTTEEFVTINDTGFVKRDNEHFYHWKTDVELRQVFKPKDLSASTTSVQFFDSQRLRKLLVSVKWRAKISISLTSDFTEERIEGIDLIEEKFGIPSWDDLVQLRHPATIPRNSLGERTDSPPPPSNVISNVDK
jgi:hypothetical protein